MSFGEIFCQDKAIAQLMQAFAADRVAHATLFAGMEGVGKFTTARAWARLLLCHETTVEGNDESGRYESCGRCESCRAWEAGSHPDFHHVYKELRQYTAEGKSKVAPIDLPIDVIREFLIERVAARPTLSSRRVFVVDESEKLNSASQNALLKVLEEPPGHCCIILLCTRLERLLPTIKSRAQIVRFGPIEAARVVAHLQGRGLDVQRATFLARLAQGSLGLADQWAALECADHPLYERKRQIVAGLAQLTLADTLQFAAHLLEEAKSLLESWTDLAGQTSRADLKRRSQKTIIRILISLLDDVMKWHLGPSTGSGRGPVNADQGDCIAALAARVGPEQAALRIADGYEAMQWIEAGVNDRLLLERLLLKIVKAY